MPPFRSRGGLDPGSEEEENCRKYATEMKNGKEGK